MKPEEDYSDEGNCSLAAGVTILAMIVIIAAISFLAGWIK